ncbi:hypothetical protein L6452_39272 [Arctium lappa]|uniref:Uncharacterized protein n=1 Tax=Arctium lappa TaxID=4217 RepID=A0ACB8XSK3_ARCLA|nr:hypothetical protein L6452_39272 [Arctium lappa]
MVTPNSQVQYSSYSQNAPKPKIGLKIVERGNSPMGGCRESTLSPLYLSLKNLIYALNPSPNSKNPIFQ